MDKDINILRNLLKWILPILSLATFRVLVKFTQLHILYFPEEISLFNHEYILLFASLIIFIVSIYYKIKISMTISFASIVLALINITGFTVAAVLYYKELYLNQFI